MGTDPSGDGTSPEVITISGTADRVTDFSAEVVALQTYLVFACVRLSPSGAPTYAVLRRT